MLKVETLRTLHLLQNEPGDKPYISSASGLVRVGSWLYVVPDDELHLGIFRDTGCEPGRLFRLFPGHLPEEHEARKEAKPDLEVLIHLPAVFFPPGGALVAMPSGSTANRQRGAWVALSADGGICGEPQVIDFGNLYERLRQEIRVLNIEGASYSDGWLTLFQRGDGAGGQNSTIDIDAGGFVQAISVGQSPDPRFVSGICDYDLGVMDSARLSFTDAAPLKGGRIMFVAAAEATDNPHDDGPCMGSVVGILDQKRHVETIMPIDHPGKVEGLWVEPGITGYELLMVTDSDSDVSPSELLSANWLVG